MNHTLRNKPPGDPFQQSPAEGFVDSPSQTELPARKENKTCGWGLCGGCPHHPESPPPPVLGVSGSAQGAPGFGFDPDVLDLNFCAAAGKKGAEAGGRRLPSPDPGGRGPGTWMERPSWRGGGREAGDSALPAARSLALSARHLCHRSPSALSIECLECETSM